MDSLHYYYYANTNQLKRITDAILPNAFTDNENRIIDIDSQPDSNYVYDSIGNLVQDKQENIDTIKWNVYGKIEEIIRRATATVPASNIKYTYDAMGNRISQVVTADGIKKYTWYVRDAQGNILTTYSAEGANTDLGALDFKLSDRFLYGSSRLGTITVNESANGEPGSTEFYYENRKFSYDRGYKQYELTNHLGNVLATISDRKFGVSSGGSSLISYYDPHIVTAQDYYPFGMLSRVSLPNSGKAYKFGFNGKLNDNDVKGGLGNQQDYGMRIYDPRIGRFLSVDPLTKDYPWYTPYQFAGNKPIMFIDLDGLEEAVPKYNVTIPKLRNPSESTCAGCIERSRITNAVHNKGNFEEAKRAYEAWRSNPDNIGKPLPGEFRQFTEAKINNGTLQQGGYLGSNEYKKAKANYDTYGQYLPGLSDLEDITNFGKAVSDGNVSEAGMYAFGFIAGHAAAKLLKGPLHHIFTNKNFLRGQKWSKRFAPMFEKAGYKLDDALNKINVPGHKGPHPDEYHEIVFDRLEKATKGLDGAEYKKAFENTLESLRKEVTTKGTMLNKLLTKEK